MYLDFGLIVVWVSSQLHSRHGIEDHMQAKGSHMFRHGRTLQAIEIDELRVCVSDQIMAYARNFPEENPKQTSHQ